MTTTARSKPRGLPLQPGAYAGPSPDGVRKNMYPEELIGSGPYRDTGCDVIETCLGCPLPRCLEELTGEEYWSTRLQSRDADIVRLRKRGMRVAKIASKHGVSVRTVHRVCTKEKAK